MFPQCTVSLYFGGGTEAWTHRLTLPGLGGSSTMRHSTSPFTLCIFQAGPHIFARNWLITLLPMASRVARLRSGPPCPACLLSWGLANLFLRLVSNCNPPDRCLSSNWDYRHEPPHLHCLFYLWFF
jgi:hypothetical protein